MPTAFCHMGPAFAFSDFIMELRHGFIGDRVEVIVQSRALPPPRG
jgi:hypothetical protein